MGLNIKCRGSIQKDSLVEVRKQNVDVWCVCPKTNGKQTGKREKKRKEWETGALPMVEGNVPFFVCGAL
jgi:hypothetical protein